MKYKVDRTGRFRREYRKLSKRGYNMTLIEEVISILATGKNLDLKHRDHPLAGDYTGFRECHIAPDWLLIYKIEADMLILVFKEPEHIAIYFEHH